jgi:hypothetical protein
MTEIELTPWRRWLTIGVPMTRVSTAGTLLQGQALVSLGAGACRSGSPLDQGPEPERRQPAVTRRPVVRK